MAIVNLTGNYAPGKQNWHRGTIRKDIHGVYVKDSHGEYFYPWPKVERIEP